MLALDRDLTGWRVPENDFTRGHLVALCQTLSRTAGIGVPDHLFKKFGAYGTDASGECESVTRLATLLRTMEARPRD